MRGFYISSIQVKMTYSLPRAYAVFCDRFIITVNIDYQYAQKQGKLASVCLHRLSSIFVCYVVLSYVLYFMETLAAMDDSPSHC